MTESHSFAHVALGLPLEGHFDYIVPPSMRDHIQAGQRVRVSFGRSARVGYVIGFSHKSTIRNLKPISELLDSGPVLDQRMLKLTEKFAGHYGCSRGEAIETSLPTALRKGRSINLPKMPQASPEKLESQEDVLIHDKGGDNRWDQICKMIDQALIADQGVLFLVPEVSILKKITARLRDHFDIPIGTLDKKLTAKKELEEWLDVFSSKARLVVGTRSAAFAPLQRLGLIVIYDEENTSYKQEQMPCYHVRDVAKMRKELEHCQILYVSAAPSAETWWQAQKAQIQKLDTSSGAYPSNVQLVDLTNYKKSYIISVPLRIQIEDDLRNNRKIVLFFNLRGEGVEKIESIVRRLFPEAKTAKYDKESARIPKRADIILATQAILKAGDQLPISTLAVLSFDAEINKMDFRSAQKAFTLLCHLREITQNQIIIQTNDMDNYCLKAFLKSDNDGFYKKEIKFRRSLGFPPFKHLVAVSLRGEQEERVVTQAYDLYSHMKQGSPRGIEIIEPYSDVFPKLRDRHRFTIMLKGSSTKRMLGVWKAAMKDFKKGSTIVSLNVDP